MTGGDQKNRCKSYNYTLKFAKNFKSLSENLKNLYEKAERFLTPRCEKELSRGAVLIEFAICIPILIILLFYIHDLVKIKRYYSQTEFVAQQAVNMIQNISQNRTNKEITIKDLKYVCSLAWLTLYPAQTMYVNSQGGRIHDLSHEPWLHVFYVKGLPDGKASIIWGCLIFGNKNAPNWGYWYHDNSCIYTNLQWKTNAAPESIYPSLKIQDGEVKIIIDTHLYCNSSIYNKNANITSKRQAFGCHLVFPKHSSSHSEMFFNSVVVFTPKPGLFSETAPS